LLGGFEPSFTQTSFPPFRRPRATGLQVYPGQHSFSPLPHSSGMIPQLKVGADVSLNCERVGADVSLDCQRVGSSVKVGSMAGNEALGDGEVAGVGFDLSSGERVITFTQKFLKTPFLQANPSQQSFVLRHCSLIFLQLGVGFGGRVTGGSLIRSEHMYPLAPFTFGLTQISPRQHGMALMFHNGNVHAASFAIQPFNGKGEAVGLGWGCSSGEMVITLSHFQSDFLSLDSGIHFNPSQHFFFKNPTSVYITHLASWTTQVGF